MAWKCPPLHLPNWNNLWKWKEQMNSNESFDRTASHMAGDYVSNTEPVADLTDEEILKMAADRFHYSEYKLVIEFARAILRKAQEK
jgi:hypothetical protein